MGEVLTIFVASHGPRAPFRTNYAFCRTRGLFGAKTSSIGDDKGNLGSLTLRSYIKIRVVSKRLNAKTTIEKKSRMKVTTEKCATAKIAIPMSIKAENSLDNGLVVKCSLQINTPTHMTSLLNGLLLRNI